MELYDLLEIFRLLEVCTQLDPILLNDLFREIVNEALYEVDDLVIGDICLLEAVYIGLAGVLELYPAEIELPLDELEPEHVAEEALVLGDGSLVEDQVQGEGAFEVQSYVVHVSCVFFHEGFLGEVEGEHLGLEGFYAVDLLEDCRALEFQRNVVLVDVVYGGTGPDVQVE